MEEIHACQVCRKTDLPMLWSTVSLDAKKQGWVCEPCYFRFNHGTVRMGD